MPYAKDKTRKGNHTAKGKKQKEFAKAKKAKAKETLEALRQGISKLTPVARKRFFE